MANANRGLGKGLGALLGDAALRTDTSDNLYLPISQIEPYANQPRRHFDEEALQDLADSIREHGIIQPLTVRRLSSGYYQIIAGERRWRAARIAGLAEVPAIVIEADDRKMTELSLIENLQREDLDPIEEAEGYKTLMDNYHLTQEEAAERVGKSRSAVANSLRLLGLCPEVRQMLQNGDLSGGHARALLPLKADLQLDAANLIVKQGLSVRQTEALAKRLANPKEERKPTNDELIAESYGRLAAQELSDKIGRTCRIVSGKKKGRIELDYYGIDDLNDLLEALAVLGQQRNLLIDQRRDSVDLFLTANGQDRVQITRIINARHKVMRVRDIQSRCQLGQVSGNDPVAVIHGLAKVLEQLNAPSGAAE